MKKVIAVCGKVCAGKSYYSRKLKEEENAVVLSCDEFTKVIFDNNLNEKLDETLVRIREYLLIKAEDIVATGTTVILEWGFWSKKDRDDLNAYLKARQIPCEWHYIEVSDEIWNKHIEERNQRVLEGKGGSDYRVGNTLRKKLQTRWEDPTRDEIDVWHVVNE